MADKIDPKAQYRVKLKFGVIRNGVALLTTNDNVVKGKVLVELGDAVESYERVG